MNPKIVLWTTLTLLIVIPSTWFGWSAYQRSETEKLLNSISSIMSESSSDIPINIDKLQTKIQELQTAISIMQRVPPSSKDLYKQAQSNLNQLQTRQDNLSQILQTELKIQKDLEQAESLAKVAIEIGAKPRNTSKEWNRAYTKWQEAISILQRIPKSRFVLSKIQQKLSDYQESATVVSKKISGEQKALDLLNRAKDLANQAVKIAQNPPHPKETWALAYGKWSDTIALLEQIPSNTSVTAEAKQMLKEYQRNQAVILKEYRKREILENQARQANEFESFFVELSSDTKDSLRELKNLGYSRQRFTGICFQIITDNIKSTDLAERGFELNSYATGICNYVWDRL